MLSRFDVGDEVTIEYKEGEETNTVLSMNGTEVTGVSEKTHAGETDQQNEDITEDQTAK